MYISDPFDDSGPYCPPGYIPGLPRNPTPSQRASIEYVYTRNNTILRTYRITHDPLEVSPDTRTVVSSGGMVTNHEPTITPMQGHVEVHLHTPVPGSWRQLVDILQAVKLWPLDSVVRVDIIASLPRATGIDMPADVARYAHLRQSIPWSD
jgi:hypothetical protein